MKNVKTCPSCGRSQQSKDSRHCTCGDDSGSDAQFVPMESRVEGNPHVPRGRISARATFFQKRVFPLLFSVIAGATILDSRRTNDVEWPIALFQSCFAAAVLFAVVKATESVYLNEVLTMATSSSFAMAGVGKRFCSKTSGKLRWRSPGQPEQGFISVGIRCSDRVLNFCQRLAS